VIVADDLLVQKLRIGLIQERPKILTFGPSSIRDIKQLVTGLAELRDLPSALGKGLLIPPVLFDGSF
jgi:hypothetical protein